VSRFLAYFVDLNGQAKPHIPVELVEKAMAAAQQKAGDLANHEMVRQVLFIDICIAFIRWKLF
jgi:hypothetical protein